MTDGERHRPEIVVGLVATPPDYPARVAARLTAELADRLAERVDADVRWTVREGWGEVAPPGAESRWCPCPRWECASCERSARPFRIWWAGCSPTLPTSGCRRPRRHRPSWPAGLPPSAGWSARLMPGNCATSPRG